MCMYTYIYIHICIHTYISIRVYIHIYGLLPSPEPSQSAGIHEKQNGLGKRCLRQTKQTEKKKGVMFQDC